MRRLLVVLVILLLTTMGSATFTQDYEKNATESFRYLINDMAPDSGLLGVECSIVGDCMYMNSVIGNVTYHNLAAITSAALLTYKTYYNATGYPDKANVIVNMAWDAGEIPILDGSIYSIWVEEYNEDAKINSTDALYRFSKKFGQSMRFAGKFNSSF